MKYLLALLLLPIQVLATNFYVSNSGNDANPGTLAQPWATINRINSSMGSFLAGDSILFQCGSSFSGTLYVTRSGIIISSYGTGNKPVITSFYTIPSLASAGTNLWSATIPMTRSDSKTITYGYMVSKVYSTNSLTIDGRLAQKGRFPNKGTANDGWIQYNSMGAGNPTTINSSAVFPFNFVGGDIAIRKRNWVIDVLTITGQSGGNITAQNTTDQYAQGEAGKGFFIQNNINTLDVNDEWFFNNTSKVFTLFSTTNPSTKTIRIPLLDTLIVLGASTGVTIDNLDIQGASTFGIVGTGGNTTIKNSIIRNISYWGIYLTGSNAIIDNCLVRDIGSNGIWIQGANSLVSNSIIKNIGSIEGYGGNSDYQYEGIHINNSGTIRNNILDTIGFHGIHFDQNNIVIRENFIQNVAWSKVDCGGIYSWDGFGSTIRSNRQVKRNIVVNLARNLGGTPDPSQCYALYMDGGTNNVILDSNFAGNLNTGSFKSQGIRQQMGALQLNGPVNLVITNNILYGYPNAMAIVKFPNIPNLNNNTITNNGFYIDSTAGSLPEQNQSSALWYMKQDMNSPAPPAFPAQFTALVPFIQQIGTINNNFYSARNNTTPWDYWSNNTSFTAFYNPPNLTLTGWRNFCGQDLNSSVMPFGTGEIVYNPKNTDSIYSFSGRQKRDYRGNVYNNSAIVPRYYGNIFFDNGPATGSSLQASSTATQINCFGGNSTVTVSATGGTPPYSGTGNFTRAAGTWSFTVTDAATPTPNTITTTITITQPLALTATSSKTDILCNGQTNGSINVFPIGGTPPYSYNWGGGITTQNRTGLAIGTYTCTITDSRNCLTTTSQTISQPTALTAGNPTAPNILVNGGTTTITQPAATGGTSPYQYQLNTGAYQTSNVFSNVSAGTYTINIRDANNCIISKLITITQPVVFSASASAGNISCNGGTTIVVVSASGGTPPYTGTGTFVVTAGAYNYIVTDAGGSTASASITVTQPSALTLSATQVNVLCNGNSTGSINTTPGGGTPPYTYLWNTGQTTQNRTGLSANTYSVTLTDANTCSTSKSITITQPAALSVTATRNPTNILCFGGTSAVTITASGGRSPYSGIGTFNQSVGTITYNVTDANSCPASQSVTLTQPTQLTAANPTATPITVNGGTTTIVQPVPSGGTFPYMYSLNTGAFQTSNAFQNTPAGSYSVTIRDANGCTIIKSITITQPAVFTATATQTVPINCNGQRATIVVSATGGTSPYTGTGTFQVGSGQYVFTVTDSLGNTAPASITVTQPSQVIATSTAGAITSIGGTTNIIVSAVGGIQPYAGTGSFPRQAGTYSFTVTDANGCPSVTTITVNQPTPIPNQAFVSPLPIRNGN